MKSLLHALPVAALIGLAAPSLTAQVALGVRAGASLSEFVVTGVVIEAEERRRGIMLGLTAAVPLHTRFGVEFGVSYVQRGSNSTLASVNVDFWPNYLQASMLGTASAPVFGETLALRLLAGPALGRETSCKQETRFLLQPIVVLLECDDPESNPKTTTYDFGLVGGAGVRFSPAGRISLTLDLLYSHGLRSILDTELAQTAENRAFTLQAGLDFPIS